MTSKPQIEVLLTLTGQGFSPEDVTAMISLAPTKTWRAGDLIGKSKLKRKQDGWAFGLPKREALEVDALLQELLDAVEPYKGGIAQVLSRFSLEIEVACVIYIEEVAPVFTITADTMRRLVALGSDFDIDIILLQ